MFVVEIQLTLNFIPMNRKTIENKQNICFLPILLGRIFGVFGALLIFEGF
jgi:hypothetical protein